MAFNPNLAPVKVQPGQSLAYVPGKGYVASGKPTAATFKPRVTTPPGTRPIPPVDPFAALGTGALDARATTLANASLLPQQQEIARQQELARQSAAADKAAITGFRTAESGLLKNIPGQVGQGYQDAAKTVGSIGTGVGGQVGADLAAQAQQGRDFEASQGQQGGSTLDPAAVGDTVGYLGGVLPGASLAERGAAEQARAARAIEIPLDAGREELDARMATARAEQDTYAQQLISLAATFPGLKAQALQQLNTYEIDKANYRESKKVSDANITAQTADTVRQDRAERAQETAAGIKADNADALMKYRWASLRFANKKEAAKAQAATQKGKTIDVQASKLLRHIVYKDGTEDPSIKVAGSTATTPQQKAQVNRAKATSKARVDGFKYATKIMGKPELVDKKAAAAARYRRDPVTGALPQIGKYVADPKYASIPQGHPGAVFPATPGLPATTNKLSRASHTGSGASDYADAQTKVWGEIDGDGLMSRYNYSRQQVLAIVNASLARAGWRK